VSSSVQSDSQRVFVQQKYPPDKLYQVTTPYTAADLMDISVTEGVCVGLIVDKDPMGNKNRWFVDDGGMYDILGNYGKFSVDFYAPTKVSFFFLSFFCSGGRVLLGLFNINNELLN